MTYYNRSIEIRIREAFSDLPAVFLNGPRQAGKSTLMQHIVHAHLKADYVTFDDITTLAAAANDPEGFLRRFHRPVVIDEVQMVPDLFRVLKRLIDERRIQQKVHSNGQFLLTGSANILTLPGLAEALVGRMIILSLYPLSAIESLHRNDPVINGWFDQDVFFKKETDKHFSFHDTVYKTSFPELAAEPKINIALWFDSYLTTLLQRDVRQLAEVEKIAALPNIVKILAVRAGNLLNDADCARDAKLNAMTYRRYRALLEQLFLIALVPPWSRNRGKRFVKSPKLYFVDTALLCHQLGVDADSVRQNNPGLFGHLLENFVASELTKQLAILADGSKLYHFRTHEGREVDFVIERRNGKILGIEVKARNSVTAADCAELALLKQYAGEDFSGGIVLYLGHDTIPFGHDIVAMPLEGLWQFNMKIATDKDIKYASDLDACIFWADYGDTTRIRCLIPQTIIDDYFHDHATEKQSLAAIGKHWETIWQAFMRKIRMGAIETVVHARRMRTVDGRDQKIKQVVLTASDFGSTDFRELNDF